MKGSCIIVAFFVIGIVCGRFNLLPFDVTGSKVSLYALYALMFFVGISVGSDSDTLKHLKELNPRWALLPVMTILGTVAGSSVACLFLPDRSLPDCLAVGSGLGYYSLSSVFITTCRGAELGTVALLCNLLREILTLLLAPLILIGFGRLAPIAAGGATTMDTTLPIITRTCGKEFFILSIIHGFVTDFSVPFLVTFFCSL